jgi:hypothetical protein
MVRTDPDPRPADTAGLVIWVKRASGFTAGYAQSWEQADNLRDRCNANVPGDPARVEWAPSLSSYTAAEWAAGTA